MRRAGAVMCALVALIAVAPSVAQARKVKARTDIRAISGDYNQGKPLPLTGRAAVKTKYPKRAKARARRVQAGQTPPVGTVKSWWALNDAQNIAYLKAYTLEAVTAHMEVWVANDLEFPAGDCRNDERVVITRTQAEYLADQFESDMYPTESSVFSVPPPRDGSQPLVTPPEPGYWGGSGDRIVTLIDNVRDDHFYDTNNAHKLTYIAGFFYSIFNEFVDRNVMTVDAFDWLHRTGANPPNEPSSDPCTNADARPFLYEGVFAHEYQHLLEYYEDPDEMSWVNEGISDWAQTLTGYKDPSTPITELGFDNHVQCFLGWLGVKTPVNPIPRAGGPENSLTLWGDQPKESEVLCDYGAAYTFMEFVQGRYGNAFMSALHRTDGNGFTGLQEALDAVGSNDSPTRILHDWAAMVALDGVLDRGANLLGASARRLTTPTLDAYVNWDTSDAYDFPGAPPNGSDYVRVRDADGDYIGARQLRSLSFDGAETLEPKPIEWTVDANPEGRAGNPALFSGSGANFDRSIVRSVTVPAANPTLSFQTRWDTEAGWDFGFVQVSTDGGATYHSLADADTTTEHDPGAIQQVVDNLPGFTDTSGGWKAETFDLSAYAGQSILLAFRYVTDSGVNLPGWWIDDVSVGGQLLSDGSSLDGWQSTTQVRPVPVQGYTVQLVGYSSRTLERAAAARASRKHRRHHGRRSPAFRYVLRVGADNQVSLNRRQLRGLVRRARRADVVSVLVMQDDPTELVDQYARYALTVNGVLQPGG